ncbi:MAG: hypothetical protein HBSAPP02_16630 [Phycisphaerae bacterium]|nr:MAG: hypothetical protein DCC66_06185 [Planctomycetota bacterium]GJQ26631.1 MAG: hypothetical protein HBSAPP02_16630 [Phycisphaerae bacterium]
MSKFLESKNRIGLLGGLISLTFAIAAADAGDVLLYSDHSPGSLAAYVAWNEYFEENEDVVFLVNTTGAFETLLGTGPWDHVVVLERFSTSQPSYLGLLQDEAWMGTPVDFEIWHDNNVAQSDRTIVSAVSALVAWRDERTAMKYTNRTAPPACIEVGFGFPGFESIELASPSILLEVPPSTENAILSLISLLYEPGCRGECLEDWKKDMGICTTNYNTHTGNCYAAYPVPPAKDIENQTNCLNTAATDQINCRNGARNRYNTCLAACPPSQ